MSKNPWTAPDPQPGDFDADLAILDDNDTDHHEGDPGAALVHPDHAEASLTCFVIGPIGNRLAAHGTLEREAYEESLRVMAEVIEPACKRVGLSPVRADTLARAGEITDQIFRRLHEDDVVIADLTGANANVMYELGLRHTRNKLTVQIGEYGRLPFDVNTIRTIQFSRSAVGLINARDELALVLAAGLIGDYDPVTATRIWTEPPGEAAQRASPARDSGEVAEADASVATDERGFLEVMVDWEDQLDALVPALESVNEYIVKLGSHAEASAKRVAHSDAAGKGMRGRLQVATQYATGLEKIADGLEEAVDNYSSVLEAVSAGTLALIGTIETDPKQLDEPNAMDFAVATRGAAATTRESNAALAELVESIKANSQLSRVLREPSRKLTEAFDRFVIATSTVDEWDRRLQSLGVPQPPPGWDAEEPSRGELQLTDPASEVLPGHQLPDGG